MQNKKFDLFSRIEDYPSRFYMILAILALAIHSAICTYTEASPALVGTILILIFILISVAVTLLIRRRLRLYRVESSASEEQNGGVIYTFRNRLKIPYAVVNGQGQIVTLNLAMRRAFGFRDSLFNFHITDLCGITLEQIIERSTASAAEPSDTETPAGSGESAPAEGETGNNSAPPVCSAEINGRKYRIDCHPIHTKGTLYYMLVFNDVTELENISRLYHDEQPAVAYIILDNLEEIAQYVKSNYQTEANEVANILKNWAASMGGILREYDRNKYLLLFSQQNLLLCIKNKFEVLDNIREIRIGEENIPITVSMGVAMTGTNLAQREHDALVALDTALQRGGDQAVVKNNRGVFYFGGRTKSQQKRTSGQSRIYAKRLCDIISNATNVIVMGHSNPDFDSIGACVGVAALARYLGVDVKIVVDTESENFRISTARLIELSDYKNCFVDGVTGLEGISFGTLLVVVDANNFAILEAPEIANNAFKIALIDHHIKKEEFEQKPNPLYIDPSASSACELVSEILEQSLPAGVLRKEEANIMMAGIMVDTKNFTRTVGTRTFAAALYLRGAGASTEYARTFFEEAFEDYRSESQFGTEARIYRDQLAITAIAGTGSSHDRIAAAKAADKLLTIRNINAAFALILIGETVHISARSNGNINVQLILEKIGGGGHFDVAGAALPQSSLEAAEKLLCEAIDSYFSESAAPAAK